MQIIYNNHQYFLNIGTQNIKQQYKNNFLYHNLIKIIFTNLVFELFLWQLRIFISI